MLVLHFIEHVFAFSTPRTAFGKLSSPRYPAWTVHDFRARVPCRPRQQVSGPSKPPATGVPEKRSAQYRRVHRSWHWA